MYMVLEYMQKGDLINFLKEKDLEAPGSARNKVANNNGLNSPMNDADLWNIFKQVSAGIRYLHHQNIVHGDIKPQVNSDGTMVLHL